MRGQLQLLKQKTFQQFGDVAGNHPILCQTRRQFRRAPGRAKEPAGMFNRVGADIAQQVAGMVQQGPFGRDIGGKDHGENGNELQPRQSDREHCPQ